MHTGWDSRHVRVLSTKGRYGFEEIPSAQFVVLMEADMSEITDEGRNWRRMSKRRRKGWSGRRCTKWKWSLRRKRERLIEVIVKFTP